MIQLPAKLVDCEDALTALAVVCNGFLARDAMLAQSGQISAARLPDPYRRLLDHHDHMTKVLQEHYGRPVKLDVLEAQETAHQYSRLIRLSLPDTGRIVEVGIARINLAQIPAPAREEILARSAPLGDILIRHDVLRQIEPRWFLRFRASCPILGYFEDGGSAKAGRGRDDSRQTYGRIGVIECDGAPAVELLEIVAPDA